MKTQQLDKIQRAIEKFFFKARFNIVLHNVLEHENFKEFTQELDKAIETQIVYFAKVQRINQVIGVSKSIDDAILEAIGKLWLPITQLVTERQFRDYYIWVAETTGQTIMNIAGSQEKFALSDNMHSYITNRGQEAISHIDNTTIMLVAGTITRGYESGETHYQIAKMVRSAAEKIANYRAETIAEHEAALLIGELTMDVFKENGIEYKKLITSRDEVVCPICNTDEQAGIIKRDEKFPSGVLSAPVHIGCRCFIVPVKQTN